MSSRKQSTWHRNLLTSPISQHWNEELPQFGTWWGSSDCAIVLTAIEVIVSLLALFWKWNMLVDQKAKQNAKSFKFQMSQRGGSKKICQTVHHWSTPICYNWCLLISMSLSTLLQPKQMSSSQKELLSAPHSCATTLSVDYVFCAAKILPGVRGNVEHSSSFCALQNEEGEEKVDWSHLGVPERSALTEWKIQWDIGHDENVCSWWQATFWVRLSNSRGVCSSQLKKVKGWVQWKLCVTRASSDKVQLARLFVNSVG